MLPKINQPVEIYDPENNCSYTSNVADISDEHIFIGYPITQNNMVFWLTGTSIETHYVADGNKYSFSAEILGRRRDNIPLYIVKKPQDKEIRKVQRREYIRVQTTLQVHYNESMFHTIDISGGGFLFSCKKEWSVQMGNIYKGVLFLSQSPSAEPLSIPFEGQVVRIVTDETEDIKKVAVGFIKLDEKNRQKIIQYCLRTQLKMKR